MVKQILVGLVFAGLGGAIVFYTPGIIEMFGRVNRFEKNLGGTKSGYTLVGFVVIIIGFLILFGVIPLSPQTDNLGTFGTTVPAASTPSTPTTQSLPVAQ